MGNNLVSVIIPCYNHAHFLEEAIISVFQQDWPCVEIIVVDDGSTDSTREVVAKFDKVKYIYQENQGLSNARNKGISNSFGKFLVMLDADDWLFPDAIAVNIQYLIENPLLAFVSGAYVFVDECNRVISETYNPIKQDYYLKLLERNYIGSPAAVMYQRWVFDTFHFDKAVDSCSDYDIYLRIAREHPVSHHTVNIAAYRIHGLNMSSNIPLMLSTALLVLQNHQKLVKSKVEMDAISNGKKNFKKYYSAKLLKKIFTFSNYKNVNRYEAAILISNISWLIEILIYDLYLVIKRKFN